MGSIMSRQRGDGTIGHTAVIRIKKGGRIVHRETETFDRKQAAQAWLKKREAALAEPGALETANRADPTLGEVIDRYIAETEKAIGRTKAQVLGAIKRHPIAAQACSSIASSDITAFAKSLDVSAQTRANYVSHLAAIFAIARPMWGFPLDRQAMQDAQRVAARMGITSKSRKRDRRPSLLELDAIMQHFIDRQRRRPESAPMHKIIPFAIFSTRRLEEITRIAWADYDPDGARVLVRDMKNPGDKAGNDVWCDVPGPALAIVRSMPRAGDAIFPYTGGAIGAAFTRACKLLGIEDLHFHDLRHEGISRLFEMGWSIPRVASVSGHRSWTSLRRYTHLRETGDRFEGWRWLRDAV